MKYNPQDIEKKWQDIWEKTGINQAQSSDIGNNSSSHKATKGKYYCLDMFPYPSGSGLHVGHWRGYVLSDVAARIKKAQGYNVLHPMGWDAFGLPAENYALKMGVHPRISTDQNITAIKKQLQQMGTCFDWSREVDTTDPEYYKFTQWIFIQMYQRGLAYREDSEVNWCEELGTVLANEEVIDGKSERGGHPVTKKKIPQWVLKITAYADRLLNDLDALEWPEKVKTMQRNWIGRSTGVELKFKIKSEKVKTAESAEADDYIEVFTTRVDTLFGCTYVVLAPEHEMLQNKELGIKNYEEIQRYIKQAQAKTNVDRLEDTKEKTGVRLEGITVINPVNNKEIPVYVADYVLGDYGTGAVMAVPAHDERDWEFAKKFNLPIIETIVPSLIDEKNPPVTGKKTVERKTVQAIVHDPKTDKYLVLKWTKHPWITFPMGGVEENEDIVEAARREILEETGFKNLKFIKTLGGQVRAEYFANHKNENRVAFTTAVVFELIDYEKETVSEEESSSYDLDWFTKSELTYPKIVHTELVYWLERWDKKNLAYTDDGLLINSGEFSGIPSEEARKKITEKLASSGAGESKTNFKLRDWIFSRQRYWGEPIPLVHCVTCEEKVQNAKLKMQNSGENGSRSSATGGSATSVEFNKLGITQGEWDNPGWIPVPESELPLRLPEVEKYEPTGTGQSPLAGIPEFVNTTCPQCGGNATRETNTMPQWAGSCWYYMAYAIQNQNVKIKDQNNGMPVASLLHEEYKQALKNWLPVDLYVGGVEHAVLHLLYARFWYKFLYDIDVVAETEPFKHLFNQGMVTLSGAKMSKSKGNVVSPDEMIAKYGTDALRAYELFIAPPEQDAEWNSNGLSGVARFLSKVWDLAISIAEMKNEKIKIQNEGAPSSQLSEEQTALQVKTHQTIKKYNEALVDFRYNTLVSTLMEFTNFLSDHREILKSYPQPVVILTQLLSPICPHIAEEIWQEKFGFESSLFSGVYDWPEHDEKYLIGDLVTITVQENGKLRGTIEITPDSDQAQVETALRETKYASLLQDAKKVIYVKNKIINIVN